MKTVAAKLADGSQLFSFVSRQDTLGSILDHHQIMTFCNIHNGIHLTGNPCIMHGNNSFCLFCDGSFNLCFIDVHGIRSDVHKYHGCATKYKSICCRYKGISRHDHFVSRLDICQKSSQFCGMSTGCGQKALWCTGLFFNPFITFFCKISISADLLIFYCLLYILHFFTGIGWDIKSNHLVFSFISYLFSR